MASLHDVFISHAMVCPGCHAPTARYCQPGQELRADYLIDYLLQLPDRLAKRTIMQAEKRNNPHLFPYLNQRVREHLGE